MESRIDIFTSSVMMMWSAKLTTGVCLVGDLGVDRFRSFHRCASGRGGVFGR